MASVIFDDVSKSYGSTQVVKNLNLEVNEGEFLVVLGPSGCGKTTSLRMVAGFVHPDRGDIRLNGRSIVSLPPCRRNLGMVFQDYSLFPNLNVAENIAFGLVERRVAKADIARRVADLLELIRLPALGKRFPGELSGGQQQRVALARAVAYAPRVMLMDEPLGALDLQLREAMQIELHRIQRELGITTIFVTHDQDEAMNLADRIVVMAHGGVEQIGTPEDLYSRPVTAFVADFIGKINFITGQLIEGSPGRCHVSLANDVVITARVQESFRLGDTVVAAVRPEALRFINDGAASPENQVAVVVERRRFLGSSIHYFLRTVGGQQLLLVCPATAAAAAVGQRVCVGWCAEDTLLLPADGRHS